MIYSASNSKYSENYNDTLGSYSRPSISWTFDNKYMKGTYTILDLGWYLPYKEYGDVIITSFFYISFVWHVFRNLPNYISGSSSIDSYISIGVDDINGISKESNKKK